MKTRVVGVRLNEYQDAQLKIIAEKRGENEVDTIRALVNMLLDGLIVLR